MNIRTCLLPVLLAALTPVLHSSESKRTADYLLTTPATFEGKEVTLDVAFVKPVHWKSPVPEIAFFHAMTIDRQAHKPGGEMMIVILSEDSVKFAKKYGTNFEGRNESNSLKGLFMTAPGSEKRGKVWMVDTTGKVADLVAQNKLVIEENPGGGGRSGPGARPPHGP